MSTPRRASRGRAWVVSGGRAIALLLALGSFANEAAAAAIPLDLRAFYTRDPEVVVIDASTASMSDSVFVNAVKLTLDPFFGDPAIIVPLALRQLVFEYDLVQSTGNVDEFSVYLFDAAFGPLSGVLDTFTRAAGGAGRVAFDLSGYTSLTLGLQFELYDPGSMLGSIATIRDLRLVDSDRHPVPELPTWVSLVWGLLVLGALRRRAPILGVSESVD